MGDIIKNPNRNRPRPVEIRKPEYERLGVNPTPFVGAYNSNSSIPRAKTQLIPETVSEVDGSSFDEEGKRLARTSKGHIIDNNEFFNFGFSPQKLSKAVDNGDFIDLDEDVADKSTAPEVGDYILMISGKIIMSGPVSAIEEKVKAILYGEDVDFELLEVPQEDIVVLKRVDVQVGIFIKD